MALKDKLKDKLIDPTAASRSGSTIIAQVLIANEKQNTCNIKYTKTTGIEIVKDNVRLAINNTTIFDWFPNQNDYVYIQEQNDDVFITGPAIDYTKVKRKNTLSNDIFSDNYIDTLGGFIF